MHAYMHACVHACENIENKHLVALVKSKLEENRTGEWTLEKAINKLILARGKTVEGSSMNIPPEDSGYTAVGLFSKEIKMKCVYCGKDHWSDECQRTPFLENVEMINPVFIAKERKPISRHCVLISLEYSVDKKITRKIRDMTRWNY